MRLKKAILVYESDNKKRKMTLERSQSGEETILKEEVNYDDEAYEYKSLILKSSLEDIVNREIAQYMRNIYKENIKHKESELNYKRSEYDLDDILTKTDNYDNEEIEVNYRIGNVHYRILAKKIKKDPTVYEMRFYKFGKEGVEYRTEKFEGVPNESLSYIISSLKNEIYKDKGKHLMETMITNSKYNILRHW